MSKPLPSYARVVRHPRTQVEFVQVNGKLIPNQGTGAKTLAANFWDWVAKDPLHASVICGDPTLYF
jgi:hypothetical protein